MTVTNQDLLARAGEALGRMGVSKALTPTVQTTDSVATGDFMNRKQVQQLVDLTVNQSQWLGACSVKLVNGKSGELPRLNIGDIVTEGVEENGGETVSTHPDTDNIEYSTRKFKATWFVTREAIREAMASGESNFDGKMQAAFAKAMGNDLARVALRGDTTLDTSSRENRLLRRRDGWLKRLRASANRVTTDRGEAWAMDAFWRALADMPEIYRDDSELRWLMPSILDTKWQELVAAYAAQGSTLGERALTQRNRITPTGIPQLITPQIPTDAGFAITDSATADPDTVVDDGDGTITLTVDTALGGAAAGNAGRRVRVTYEGTGESEVCTVTWEGGANKVHTTGSLGQGTISTTASAYTLDLADLTSFILTNPKNLVVVMCDQVRAYRKFEQEHERWRVDVYYEADFPVFNEDAAVIVDGVIVPTFSWGN